MTRYVKWAIFKIFISTIFWLTNLNQNLMKSKKQKQVVLYYMYHKYTHYTLILIF
jgi:hypothetical protein